MTSPNFKNRTIWTGDNLDILRGMNSACVDLIYLDPPYNSNKDYAAPIGSEAAGAAFKDTWTLSDTDEAWHGEIAEQEPALYATIDAAGLSHSKSMKSYLIMMAVRLLEMRRVLKPTGSLYLHCDPTASHYLKQVLDAVFGRANFRNEIVWHYSGWNKRLAAHLEKRHDCLLFYGKAERSVFHYPARTWQSKAEYVARRRQKIHRDDSGEYVLSDGGGGKRVKRYLDDAMSYGVPCDDVWDMPKLNNSDKERTGYPTQKPLALLDRIIKASSNPGDLVLDPFCGCATAPVAAERLSRQWAGIDISSLAVRLVRQRLQRQARLQAGASGQQVLPTRAKVIPREDIPQRTDLGEVPHYKTQKHTLFGRQEGVCGGCKMVFPFRIFEVDHRVPKSKGGTDHIDNLQLLCGACNRRKGAGTQAELIAKLRQDGILD